MKRTTVLSIIWAIALVGMLFSGYLTSNELNSGCPAGGGCSSILGVPTCAYGFAMYFIIFVLAGYGDYYGEDEGD